MLDPEPQYVDGDVGLREPTDVEWADFCDYMNDRDQMRREALDD